MEINIPAGMREKLSETFGGGEGTISRKVTEEKSSKLFSKDVFQDAENEIFQLMKRDSLPRFLQSSEYLKWAQTSIIISENGGAQFV